jgi:hypothetical protein
MDALAYELDTQKMPLGKISAGPAPAGRSDRVWL